MKGHIVIYQNEDGTFSPGKFVHSTEGCATSSIPVLEARKVISVSEIEFEVTGEELPAFEYRINNK